MKTSRAFTGSITDSTEFGKNNNLTPRFFFHSFLLLLLFCCYCFKFQLRFLAQGTKQHRLEGSVLNFTHTLVGRKFNSNLELKNVQARAAKLYFSSIKFEKGLSQNKPCEDQYLFSQTFRFQSLLFLLKANCCIN